MNALNAYNRLNANVAGMKKASEKLSSGYRINRAGDDAAGLAISEKMRSQIKGLNQAIRNSQDGINMIQTFEGAAQETHSILQRMKELATESANGTYDNATDRAAIQLEFDQLNDELDQIADTDFNGTIVLNGGVMSDGLEAVDNPDGSGTFDYNNLAAQKADKIAALEKQIADLQATVPNDIAAKEVDGVKVMGDKTDIDDTTYTDAVAKDLWTDLGLSEDVASIDLQFTATKAADGTMSYKATSGVAYDKDGNELTDVKIDDTALAKITATATTKTGATGFGGFAFKGTTNAANIANAVFDATKVETGDMINFHITGPAATAKAPTNFALADKYEGGNDDLSTMTKGENVTAVGNVKVSSTLTDATMTEDIAKVLEELNGSEWTLTGTASMTNGNVAAANIACNKATLTAGAQTINGVNCFITNAADGKVIISLNNNGAAGQEILTIEGLTMTTTAATADPTKNAAKFTITYDSAFYPEAGAGPDVNVIDADLTKFSVDDKVAALEKEIEKIKDGDNTVPSTSNAYEQAKSIMTYTDDITLQTGARTKDAVNFTFKYNTDKTADMGKLAANLNLSSRADGLNTTNLSLANQKDANDAIDQIDKAINKTSMVRATFGAIQNRLEHKITNLTTTSENLTEAESSIRDTDMASEMMNYTKFNILQQAAQSMLAQANQQPQSILQLLG